VAIDRSRVRSVAPSRLPAGNRWASPDHGRGRLFLLITYREVRYSHVGPKWEKNGPENTVLQGTLVLLVLRTLEALGPVQGYGIARRMKQISRDLLQLYQGTLYPALLRMQPEGWITSRWGPQRKIGKRSFTPSAIRCLWMATPSEFSASSCEPFALAARSGS
jgi:hypothetical protein